MAITSHNTATCKLNISPWLEINLLGVSPPEIRYATEVLKSSSTASN